HAQQIRTLLAAVPPRYDRLLVECLALEGGLNPDAAQDAARAAEIAERLAARLNRRPESREEGGWTVEPAAAGGYHVVRSRRGIEDHFVIDMALLNAAEARRLDERAREVAPIFAANVVLERKDLRVEAGRPTRLLEHVLAAGRKGLAIQRYKGLGEMNPDQLWETTLDPEARTLLQVRVNQADDANEMFTRLMGDLVEPRRAFIQENALKVANLDI
ncbi:MAG: DNA gyrase subunit B, partial [Alphaproteobacteria bacterium]